MQKLIEKYGTIGVVKNRQGKEFPIINIPIISDERWQQLAQEQAVKHFRERNGREPISVEEALKDERAYINRCGNIEE